MDLTIGLHNFVRTTLITEKQKETADLALDRMWCAISAIEA